jgi:hypothetical protein
MNIEIVPMSPDSDGAKLAELFVEKDGKLSLLEENDALIEENEKLRDALSLIATNIGNGSVVSPNASLEFLTKDLPNEVKLACVSYRREIELLKARNEKLSKRHPTQEEALAQYHFIKERSQRNK